MALDGGVAPAPTTHWWEPVVQKANAAQNYVNFQTALNAPTTAGYALQNAQALGNLGAVKGAIGAQNSAAQNEAGYKAQELDNNIASTNIDINATPRQVAYNNSVYGVNGQQNDSTQAMIGQLMAGTQADYLNQQATADYAQRTADRKWADTVAAQGSSSAPETAATYSDISIAHHLASDAATNTRSAAQAQLKNQSNQALYDYTLAGLSNTEANAKLKDRNDQLVIQAKNYGLDKQALLAGVQAQIAANGLQGVISTGQVFDQINSNNIAQAQMANDILYGAVQYANSQYPNTIATTPTSPSGASYSGLPNL